VISPFVQTQRNHVTILTSASAPASSRHSRDTDLPVSQVLVLFAQFLHDNTTAWDPSLTSLGIGYQNRATKSEFEVRYSAHRSPCRISHLRAVGHLVVAVQPYDAEHVADLGGQKVMAEWLSSIVPRSRESDTIWHSHAMQPKVMAAVVYRAIPLLLAVGVETARVGGQTRSGT
jgi:hypothetical protein